VANDIAAATAANVEVADVAIVTAACSTSATTPFASSPIHFSGKLRWESHKASHGSVHLSLEDSSVD